MSEETVSTAGAYVLPTVPEHNNAAARQAFNAAFAKAQGGFLPITKNRDVKIVGMSKTGTRIEYAFRYADLQEIHAKTRPALSENGLFTAAQLLPMETGVTLLLTLGHAEGFERTSEVFVDYGDDIKQFGGRLSYMRRYMLQNMLDVAADDDLDENGQESGDAGAQQGGMPAPAPKPAPTPARKQRAVTAAAPASEPSQGEAIKPENTSDGQHQPVAEQSRAPAPELASSSEDTGELAEPGEIAFIVKRAERIGVPMAEVLEAVGLSHLNATTLQNLTKAQWIAVKNNIVTRA